MASERDGTTQPDSPDTAEQIAYRRGKSAGYSAGIADGWDACMRHVKAGFDTAIRVALEEPEAVRKHRESARAGRAGAEVVGP